jgi:hypothetical protein
MGLFTKPGSHIDRSTGRNKRDKSPLRDGRGGGVPRQIGTAKPTDRAAWAKQQKIERELRAKARKK